MMNYLKDITSSDDKMMILTILLAECVKNEREFNRFEVRAVIKKPIFEAHKCEGLFFYDESKIIK